jgi:hypothetical protein
VSLVGLCSGAYAAFRLALDDQRIVGVTLINPLVFYWSEGMSLDSPSIQQFLAARGHRDAALSLSKWRALLSGQVDVGNLLRVLVARARTWSAARRDDLIALAGGQPSGLVGDLGRLLERGVRTRIAFSDGDPGHGAFTSQIGRRLAVLRRRGMVVDVFPGADHTFSSFPIREALLHWVVQDMKRTPSPRAAFASE